MNCLPHVGAHSGGVLGLRLHVEGKHNGDNECNDDVDQSSDPEILDLLLGFGGEGDGGVGVKSHCLLYI